MSRIGKKPIAVPKGVTIKVVDGAVEVQGPKGKLRQAHPAGINFELADGQLSALESTSAKVAEIKNGFTILPLLLFFLLSFGIYLKQGIYFAMNIH